LVNYLNDHYGDEHYHLLFVHDASHASEIILETDEDAELVLELKVVSESFQSLPACRFVKIEKVANNDVKLKLIG
jgi:hypothetical protein